MSMLPTHQELQENLPLETGESSSVSRQSYHQPGYPTMDQERREESSLYTDIQFGPDHQLPTFQSTSEAPTIPFPYRIQDPDVFDYPLVPYPTKTPSLIQYDLFSNVNTVDSLFLPTGTLQADKAVETQHRPSIGDGFPPLESFPNTGNSVTLGFSSIPVPPAQPIPQTAENSEIVEDEGEEEEKEEGGDKTVLQYSGGGAWKCAICSKSFRRRRRAVLHVVNKHNNIRIRCNGKCGNEECDKSFAAQEGLDVHVRRVTVECNSCGKSMLKKNLYRHVKLYCPQGGTG